MPSLNDQRERRPLGRPTLPLAKRRNLARIARQPAPEPITIGQLIAAIIALAFSVAVITISVAVTIAAIYALWPVTP